MLKKTTKAAIQFDASDLPPPIDARQIKRKREKGDIASPTIETTSSKTQEPIPKSKKIKSEEKPPKNVKSKAKKDQEVELEETVATTRPRRRGVITAPISLRFTVKEWTEEEETLFRAAVKKHGVPTPTDANVKKPGLWYSVVSNWEKIGKEVGRSPSECRFRWYGPLDQQL